MGEWLSSCVKEQPEVREALSDLADKILEYKDAAKPSACRETGGSFWSPELTLFRPGWKLFTVISVGCGVAGIIFSLLVPTCRAGAWADLALKVSIPLFVIGISLVSLARSISESRKFAGEYLNDSCRTPWFCCLTLVAVLCGIVGHFVATIENIPNVVIVGICMASVGAAINCLAMLAFVVRETIRCSVPSESVGVVSRYAARKLTWGYLKEAYIKFLGAEHRDYLEKWCAGNAIHPPSKYYGHYFRSSLHSGNGDNDAEIELEGHKLGQGLYKDYDLKGLAKLDKYLKKNNAELYLSSPEYESERKILGILSCVNVKQNERMQIVVRGKGRKAIKWQKYNFSEEHAEFWESHLSALETVLCVAIKNGEPDQVGKYLNVALKPLSVLRALIGYKIISDADDSVRWRSYEFIRFYMKAIREILKIRESDHVFGLAHEVRNSVWEETKNLLRDMDYRTMELFTWLVQQVYALIQNEEENGKKLRDMRAQFGGFYEFADGWMGDRESKNIEDVNKMRLVLHEGLSKWLLAAIEKKDIELIEQLCDAGRRIVFGREGIKFDNKEVVAQHFVLAGYLIDLIKSGEVNATAVEKLFVERHLHEPEVDFNELVRFYLDNSLPFEKLDNYLRIFYSPTEVRRNLLLGSSHSSGFGMTGGHEVKLAFIFLAAHALKSIHPLPKPIAGMSERRITDSDVDTVSEVFKGPEIRYGCEQLKKWLKSCEEFNKAKEDREIAEAELDTTKLEEWETKFWDGYSNTIPVLTMCLKNGNYDIDDKVKNEQRYLVPKIALFNYKYPISGADGNRYGFDIGDKMERDLLKAIIEGGNTESEIKGSTAEAIREAVKWLEKEGCANNEGIIILVGERSLEIEMHKDEDFVPSWREEVKSTGFNGFYRGFPISWLREKDEDEGEESGTGEKKPQCQKVVAVDLRGWIGLKVRKEVVADRRFGELKVRTWTDEEIKQAIDSGKLEAKDADKAKGNCPVDVTFFWESVKGKLPRTRAFKFGKEEPTG